MRPPAENEATSQAVYKISGLFSLTSSLHHLVIGLIVCRLTLTHAHSLLANCIEIWGEIQSVQFNSQISINVNAITNYTSTFSLLAKLTAPPHIEFGGKVR